MRLNRSLPIDHEEELKEYELSVQKFLHGEISAEYFKTLRVPKGVYEQRNQKYMVRVRVTGGVLHERQMRVLKEISTRYSNGILHITTRGGIQFHHVNIKDTPEITKELSAIGLTSFGGGGNTVRNVVNCAYAGVCPNEVFDTTYFVNKTTQYLISLKDSYNLPRKYKIAFAGCACDCALSKVNDLGFIAITKDNQPGFMVYGGGGMGSHSRKGDILLEWIPAGMTVHVAEAVKRLFIKLGDRKNRHKARLRFVFDKIGTNEFKKQLLNELDTLKTEEFPYLECPDLKVEKRSFDHAKKRETYSFHNLKYINQKQDPYISIPLYLPLGDIKADDFLKLADFVKEQSEEQAIRTTQSQNLVIRFIKKDKLFLISNELESMDIFQNRIPFYDSITACTGSQTCKLGLCRSRNLATACASSFKEKKLNCQTLDEMTIKISGCMNACGQHEIGTIGLFGMAKRFEKRLVPYYHLLLGSKSGEHLSFGKSIKAIPAKSVPECLSALLKDFEKNKINDESFPDYYQRKGKKYFDELTDTYEQIPNHPENSHFFKDWGEDTDFSLKGRGEGECGASVFKLIEEDIQKAQTVFKSVFDGKTDESLLFEATLAIARSMLVIYGIDSKNEEVILKAFKTHFLDRGLVEKDFRELIDGAISFSTGKRNILYLNKKLIGNLIERMVFLFSVLGPDLKFRIPTENKTLEKQEITEQDFAELNLKGVGCPMNFVKAKLKLETIEIGGGLRLILDDGPPIQNVPLSFKSEGHEVVNQKQLEDKTWQVIIKKNK